MIEDDEIAGMFIGPKDSTAMIGIAKSVEMFNEPDKPCELCGVVTDLRPYGPKGENICFECGEKNPKITKQRMNSILFGEH